MNIDSSLWNSTILHFTVGLMENYINKQSEVNLTRKCMLKDQWLLSCMLWCSYGYLKPTMRTVTCLQGYIYGFKPCIIGKIDMLDISVTDCSMWIPWIRYHIHQVPHIATCIPSKFTFYLLKIITILWQGCYIFKNKVVAVSIPKLLQSFHNKVVTTLFFYMGSNI